MNTKIILLTTLITVLMFLNVSPINAETCSVCNETCSPCGGGCTATDLSFMFSGVTEWSNIGDITNWDTSCVTNMGSMFQNSNFNQDISGWVTSSVTNMENMFNGDSEFNQSIGSWDVSNVGIMNQMFFDATSFDQDLGAWTTSNVVTMNNIFSGVTLSNVNYDALLTGWGSKPQQSGVNFNAGNSVYSSAVVSYRNNLIDTYGWTITDGGVHSCDVCGETCGPCVEKYATTEIYVSPENYITNDNLYETSPSIIEYNSKYYLFYTRADEATENVSSSTYDPTQSEYMINYVSANTIEELSTSVETIIDISNTLRPEGFKQRQISTAVLNNKIYVFASSTIDSNDKSIYYYVYENIPNATEQESWTGPFRLIEDPNLPIEEQNGSLPQYSSTQISAYTYTNQENISSIYLAWSTADSSYIAVWDGESVISDITPITETEIGNLKDSNIYINEGKLYIIGTSEYEDAIYMYTASLPISNETVFNTTFLLDEAITTQPQMIITDTGMYVVSIYPNNISKILQYIRSTDGITWTTPQYLDVARYDSNFDEVYTGEYETWNYEYPQLISSNNETYIIYASENNNLHKGDGEIVFIKPEMQNSITHLTSIQNAVSLVSEDGTIYTDNNTYHENMVIHTPVQILGDHTTIVGSSDGETIHIFAPQVLIKNLAIEGGTYGAGLEYDIYFTNIVFQNCTFQNNLYGGITSDNGDRIVDARYNYWGDFTGPSGEASGAGAAISEGVRYSPWLAYPDNTSLLYSEVLDALSYFTPNEVTDGNIDPDHITLNLNLWKRYTNGAYINWQTNDSTVIDSNGKVHRNDVDKLVTLTAEVHYRDSVALSKEFTNLNVLTQTNTQDVDAEFEALTFDSIKGTNTEENTIEYYLILPTTGTESTHISWSTSNSDVIDKYGDVTRISEDKSVILSANISKGDYSVIKNFSLTVLGTINPEELILSQAKKLITIQKVLNGNPSSDEIISSLYLPSSVAYVPDFENVTIEYLSSDSTILSVNEKETKEVILNTDSYFGDELTSLSSITMQYSGETEYGPIYANNAAFSCGSCDEATFIDETNPLSNSAPLCGYESNTIKNIILNNRTLCVKSLDINKKFDIQLKSFYDGVCTDNGNGACDISGGRTSYIRTTYLGKGDVDRSTYAPKEFSLEATVRLGEKSATKMFSFKTPIKEHPAYYLEDGTVLLYDDTKEIVLNNENANHIQTIIIPETVTPDTEMWLNMQRIQNVNSKEVIIPNDLTIIRTYNTTIRIDNSTENSTSNITENKHITLNIAENSVIDTSGTEKIWNGLFIVPTLKNRADFVAPQGEVVIALELGGIATQQNLSTTHMEISKPLKLLLEGITGYSVAYSEEDNTQLIDINTICDSAYNPSNIVEGGECYFDDGTDLTIWTYHLSTFAAYNSTAPTNSNTTTDTNIVVDNTKHTISSSGSSTSSGSSSASSFKQVDCKENWICNAWTTCSEHGLKIRTCTDLNKCSTTNQKPAIEQICDPKAYNANIKNPKKALFDIIADVISEPQTTGEDLVVKLSLINFGLTGKVNANLDYTISDSKGVIVKQYNKTVPVTTQVEFLDHISTTGLKNGQYKLNIKLTYKGQNDPASTEKIFYIGANGIQKLLRNTVFRITSISVIAVIMLSLLVFLYTKSRHVIPNDNMKNGNMTSPINVFKHQATHVEPQIKPGNENDVKTHIAQNMKLIAVYNKEIKSLLEANNALERNGFMESAEKSEGQVEEEKKESATLVASKRTIKKNKKKVKTLDHKTKELNKYTLKK